MLSDDILNQLAAAVERGDMTEAEAKALVHEAVNEAHAIARQKPTETGPSKVTETGLSQEQLAVRALMAEGYTREQAMTQIIDRGLGSIDQAKIEAEAARVIEIEQRKADEAFAKTPEGIRQRAEALELAAQKHQRELQLGRVLLEDKGYSADDIASLSPDEILTATGLSQPEPGPNPDSLADNLKAADKHGGLA